MNKILELRKKRAELWNDAKAFLDQHRMEDGCLSEEDNAVYEKMQEDVAKLGKEIERLERQAAIDRTIDKPTDDKNQIEQNLRHEIDHLRRVIEQMGVKMETYENVIKMMLKVVRDM